MIMNESCPSVWTVTRTSAAVAEAIAFVELFDKSKPDAPLAPYEVGVRYSNGNEIRWQFTDRAAAIAFLRGM
jgi:hypothetical protein